MTTWSAFAAAGLAVVAVGLHGLSNGRSRRVRRILALNVASSGVFLVLVALAYRAPAPGADPIPHALVLTGIVVSVSATALALALARRLAERSRSRRASREDDPT